ncbi:hypothetical protein GCM10010272_10670 [Streptomyces lateritius]|nr:hypothetical protein GCM10010272_10670 [Streptomyces lateritius]
MDQVIVLPFGQHDPIATHPQSGLVQVEPGQAGPREVQRKVDVAVGGAAELRERGGKPPGESGAAELGNAGRGCHALIIPQEGEAAP